jgi:hypothetical protein
MKRNVLLKTLVFLVTLTVLIIPFSPVSAFDYTEGDTAISPFKTFVTLVSDGQADVVRGVYVPGVLALSVVQQPSGNSGYVSRELDVVTQFQLAATYGTIGLLAHNNLSGALFVNLAVGHDVRLIYGDGHVEFFVINQAYRVRAYEPYNPSSDFKDLDTGAYYTAMDLFKLVYQGDKHVTFQTCIANNDNLSWGRLFLIAVPVSPPVLTMVERDGLLIHTLTYNHAG